MKVTKTYLKKLIHEEIEKALELEMPNDVANPSTKQKNLQDLKMDLLKLANDLSGIEPNEIDTAESFINLLKLIKNEQVLGGEFMRRLVQLEKEAEEIKKR